MVTEMGNMKKSRKDVFVLLFVVVVFVCLWVMWKGGVGKPAKEVGVGFSFRWEGGKGL